MPTGYTSDLYEGKDIEFRQFVMKCARAFGALIELRDNPLDAPIPEKFIPSTYHQEALETAKRELARIEAWDNSEADRQAQLSFERAQSEHEKAMADKAARRQRYEAMLAQVKAWVPPTRDHQKLKVFMAQQIRESIKFDCDTGYLIVPERMSATDYKEQELTSARRDITYHTEQYENDVRRARERTEWVKALRGSLQAPANT